MRAPRIDDVYPDGLPISIDWASWDVGKSVFVPCVNIRRAVNQAREIGRRRGYTLVDRTCIEDGYLGVRIWRTT
jgi:hypothetical protein